VSWEVASFTVLGAVLIGGFAWYERSRPPSQIVALVAALAALAVAGRLAFAPIPNVVATTDIAIFSGYALGAAPGFAVGALAGLISNFWLGQGPWTPWQMAGWGLAGMLGALLARARGRRAGRLELAAACGFAGIAYGALLNFSLMVSYGGEMSLDRFGVLQARAIPFDLAHATGNVTLALLAGPAMVRMLVRFRERFEFRWDSSAVGPRSPGRAPDLLGRAGTGAAILVALALIAAALPLRPVRAATKAPAAAWLERAQNPDGGFPDTPGDESSTDMTGWAMLGLEAAGRNPTGVRSGGNSAVSYLRRHLGEIDTPGDLARTILALEGAGIDSRDFAGEDLGVRLARRERGNGSYEGWPNSTAFAVMALRASGVGGTAHSLSWLRRVRNGDGGWGAVPGGASDPDSTGAVLQALGHGSRAARRGVRYLRRTQRASGGWSLGEGGSVNTQSTAWAIQGLVAAGKDPAAIRNHGRTGLDYLAAHIARNGHYRYSSSSDQTPVWVTGQVLVAAELKAFPLAAVPRPAQRSGSSSESAAAGGAPSPSLTGHSREGPQLHSSRRTARSGPKRSGGASTPPLNPSRDESAASEDGVAAPGTGGSAVSDSAGGSSPLLPIGIGLGAAALVLGVAWFGGRRLLW
jgi:energy-coupling factor transport system substrate-specific component